MSDITQLLFLRQVLHGKHLKYMPSNDKNKTDKLHQTTLLNLLS